MPWSTDREARRKSDATYKDPEYLRNRAVAWRRAGGRCERLDNGRRCGSRDKAQVDHIKNVAAGGTHHLDNLEVLCIYHHRIKTAQEGGGYRGGRRPKADPPLVTRTVW